MLEAKRQVIFLSSIMDDTRESGAVWFWHCLDSVNAMCRLLEHRICPRFSFRLSTDEEEILSHFWYEDLTTIVAKKLSDKERHGQELQQLFTCT